MANTQTAKLRIVRWTGFRELVRSVNADGYGGLQHLTFSEKITGKTLCGREFPAEKGHGSNWGSRFCKTCTKKAYAMGYEQGFTANLDIVGSEEESPAKAEVAASDVVTYQIKNFWSWMGVFRTINGVREAGDPYKMFDTYREAQEFIESQSVETQEVVKPTEAVASETSVGTTVTVSNSTDSLKQTAGSGKFTKSDIVSFLKLATRKELEQAINEGAVRFNSDGILVLVEETPAIAAKSPAVQAADAQVALRRKIREEAAAEPKVERKEGIADEMPTQIDPSDSFGFDEPTIKPADQWDYIAKAYPDLKLRNADRANRDGYLLLTGDKKAVDAACMDLGRSGVACHTKENGHSGNKFKLIIPLYGEGGLMASEAA